MSHPPVLTGLTPRESIADNLHRAVLGLDTNNEPLFSSALLTASPDTTVTAGPFTASGWPAIRALFEPAFRIVTAHIISNIRIELEHDNADTARMTAHAISYHVRPEDALKVEDTSYTASSLYDIEVVNVREEGVWKMRRWEMKILWTVGDRSVLG
jgi:hypothetical protein